MQIAAVIAEYNPFHNGHRYQLAQMRAQGATHIVAIMSGCFVQRGEPAILSKWARARACLLGGADLVLELPFPGAIQGAEGFARAGVGALHALGCVERLCFGAEQADAAMMCETARCLLQQETGAHIRATMRQGLAHAAARQRAVEELLSKQAGMLLAEPNNILGVEYCKALIHLQSPIQPVPISRVGVSHDSASPSARFASASWLRRRFHEEGATGLSPFIPAEALSIYMQEQREGRAPCSLSHMERAVLLRLRQCSLEDWQALPDISEGLHNRLYRAARACTSVEDFLARVKSKRYTLARLRRILLAAALGVTRQDAGRKPAYLKILGVNTRGLEILSTAKKSSSISLLSSGARIEALSAEAHASHALMARATDFFSLCMPDVPPAGLEYTQPLVKLQS